MKFYEKLIITILLVFSISFVIYADDIQETETTKYQEEIITFVYGKDIHRQS